MESLSRKRRIFSRDVHVFFVFILSCCFLHGVALTPRDLKSSDMSLGPLCSRAFCKSPEDPLRTHDCRKPFGCYFQVEHVPGSKGKPAELPPSLSFPYFDSYPYAHVRFLLPFGMCMCFVTLPRNMCCHNKPNATQAATSNKQQE